MTKALTLKVKREVSERACGDGNVPLCEREGCNAIHDLHYHHDPPKQMGGAGKRIYTADSVKLLCLKCHGEWHKHRKVPYKQDGVF